jgi:PadR family transcriptional regulator, regulatory protein PadR
MSEYLGEFEQIVLLAIARLGEESKECHSARNRKANGPARECRSKKYAHSWFGDATPQREGRSKRYFRLLPEGVAALARSKSMLDRMWQGVRVKGGFYA